MYIANHDVLELLARLETQRGRYNTTGGELAESEVAEHRTDVLILVITTKLFQLDHTLGQLAVFTLLAGHIARFALRHNLQNLCLHNVCINKLKNTRFCLSTVQR